MDTPDPRDYGMALVRLLRALGSYESKEDVDLQGTAISIGNRASGVRLSRFTID